MFPCQGWSQTLRQEETCWCFVHKAALLNRALLSMCQRPEYHGWPAATVNCFQAFAFVWVLGETPGFIPSPHGRRWEMIQPKWVPAQPARSLPSPGSSGFAEGAQHPPAVPILLLRAQQAPPHQTWQSQSTLLHLGPFPSSVSFQRVF